MPPVKLWLSFFLIGVSFGSGPCLASCGPLFLSYAAAAKKTWPGAIGAYLLFSLGRIAVYLSVAGIVFVCGRMLPDSFGAGHRYVALAGGACIVLLGLLMFARPASGHGWCRKAQGFFLERDAKTVVTLGVVTGVLPCAPLLSVLSYTGLVARRWFDCLGFSLAFGLGTVVSPLLVMAVASSLLPGVFVHKQGWYSVFNRACALLIILLGVDSIRRAFL